MLEATVNLVKELEPILLRWWRATRGFQFDPPSIGVSKTWGSTGLETGRLLQSAT